jgi:hypothetical protein
MPIFKGKSKSLKNGLFGKQNLLNFLEGGQNSLKNNHLLFNKTKQKR